MGSPEKTLIADYNYILPTERIATHPPAVRGSSKLLVYKSGRITDDWFANLTNLLPADTLLVLNNTRVIRARLLFQKPSGGMIELFCLEPNGQSMEQALQQSSSGEWKCLIGGASKWKPGQVLEKTIAVNGITVCLQAHLKARLDDGFIIGFTWTPSTTFADVLQAAGDIPLPPYIKRKAEEADAERYQTVFSEAEGSVAAPTAALHFTSEIFEQLQAKGIEKTFVTLNVGAGTFKPVKADTIGEHEMHGEYFEVSRTSLEKILAAKQIVAVGTTSLRTLESLHWLGVKLLTGSSMAEWTLSQWEAYELNQSISVTQSLTAIVEWMVNNAKHRLTCRTSLLIAPGYTFRIPAAIITNFHQPGSTLLLLIAAFIGGDWKTVYHHALANDYRFLSYGDSSLLWRGGDVR